MEPIYKWKDFGHPSEAMDVVDDFLPSVLKQGKPNLETVASITSFLVNDFPLRHLGSTDFPDLVSNLVDYSEKLDPDERKEAVKRIMGMVAHNWDDTLPSVHGQMRGSLAKVMEKLTQKTEYFKNPYVRSIIRRIHNSKTLDTKIFDLLTRGTDTPKAALTEEQDNVIHTFLNRDPSELKEKIRWLEEDFKKSPSPEHEAIRNKILTAMKYVASEGGVTKQEITRTLGIEDGTDIPHENSKRILMSLNALSPFIKKYRKTPTPSASYKMLRWLCNEGLLETHQFKKAADHVANLDYPGMKKVLVSAWNDKMQPGNEYIRKYGALKKDKLWLGKKQHEEDALRRDAEADSKSQKSNLDVVYGHVSNMDNNLEHAASEYPKHLESAALRLLARHPEIEAAGGKTPGTQAEQFGKEPILIPAILAKKIVTSDVNCRPLLYYNGRFCFIDQKKSCIKTIPIRVRTLQNREELNKALVEHKQNRQEKAIRRIFGKAAQA